MDVLRKEINSVYARQHLDAEVLDSSVVEGCRREAETTVAVNQDCCVVTDAAADVCYIYAGRFGRLLGISDDASFFKEADSSDEDIIYNRIHPEDLVEKRMLEYEFFKMVDALPGADKFLYKATSRFRIRDCRERYIYVDNSTQIIRNSPSGKFWLIMCRYDLSPDQSSGGDVRPRIVNNLTGEVVALSFKDERAMLLTEREKEVLGLIRRGLASKQIADMLAISIHTVNRHRQNILEKLSVGNSVEAVMAASAMKLL